MTENPQNDFINDPAIAEVIRLLDDPSEEVRDSAVSNLGKLAGASAVPILITKLKDQHEMVRMTACYALATIGAPAVLPLIEFAQTEKAHRAAIDWSLYAIAMIGDKRAVDPLLELLADQTFSARSQLVDTLGILGDCKAVEPLIRELQSNIHYIRGGAAYALGRLGDPKAVEFLLPMIHDSSWNVRDNVVISLGQFGDERAIESLIDALGDENKRVRAEAAQALGKIGDARALPALVNMEQHEQGEMTWFYGGHSLLGTKISTLATQAIAAIKERLATAESE